MDIPRKPWDSYKYEGWISLGDWLGTNYVNTREREYLSYRKASKIIHKFNLKSVSEWRRFGKTGKKPSNIPAAPNIYYKNSGWLNWNDWLGANNKSPKEYNFLPFEKGKEAVHQYHFKNIHEWYEFCQSENRPSNLPSNPSSYYKDKGWVGWGDWLGTGFIATFNRKYRSFADAKKFVHSLKFRQRKDWRNYCKSGNKPDDIPAIPEVVYKNKGWVSWSNWLGT